MSLDEKFIPVRTVFYEIIGNLFKKIAGLFGYPANPGMPTISDLPSEIYARSNFLIIFHVIEHFGHQFNGQRRGLK
jgi:hypothetical protein